MMLNTAEIHKEFGAPGDWGNFVRIQFPYAMRIAWDLDKTIQKTWCHKDIKQPLLDVLNELLDHYGFEKIQELGIDLYGGLLNVRKKRGGRTWSTHSWGIAIDLDPLRNGLRTRAPKAQFSKPEYKPLIDIFYKHGFINYGVERGFDWMHFEFAMSAIEVKKKRFDELLTKCIEGFTSSDSDSVFIHEGADDFNRGAKVALIEVQNQYRELFKIKK